MKIPQGASRSVLICRRRRSSTQSSRTAAARSLVEPGPETDLGGSPEIRARYFRKDRRALAAASVQGRLITPAVCQW